MPGIKVKENESFENALRRFKKQCEKAGILSEIKKREYYEKPSIRRKKKMIEAKKVRTIWCTVLLKRSVMHLKERLMEDMKDSMKKGEQVRLSAIRMVRAGIKNKEIELGRELKDEDVVGVITSAIKQRKDSYTQFLNGNRMDLAEKEKKEIEALSIYLPEQMGEDEIKKRLREIISETGAATSKDIGKVMKILMPELKGKADGNLVNRIAREMLP